MSGIAGVMTRNGEPAPGRLLRAMGAALAHRGPDGDGHYRSGDVGMVQSRLAIVDLEGGDQPLYEPGGAALIANAEIYNHLELRAELAGVAFASGSDCEVPLHLHRRCGLDFCERLRGMYAIALHDPAAGRLVLARDRFGIKPLYYAETPDFFAFASEPQALIATGVVEPAVRPSTRDELWQMQFTTGRETIFTGISRILPGETVIISRGRIVERRRLAALPEGGPIAIGEDEALARLDTLLLDAVRLHLRSDVPVGILLTASVNSIALLAAMARLGTRPIHAFGITIAGAESEDASPLRVASRALGAEFSEVVLDEAEFWRLLPRLASAVDDPAADYAMLPAYKLAEAAHKAGIKAVLSGEGGDELFAGYGRYRSVIRPWWAGGRMSRARGMLDGLGVLREEVAGWRDGIAAAETRCAAGERTPLQVAQAVDCADWLPNDLLVVLDRCLMAHAVEGRVPLLDPGVADFAFRLPDTLKISRGRGKFLLRRWLMENLPVADPFARRGNIGAPVTAWIAGRAAEIGPLVAASPGVRELCNAEMVMRTFAAAAKRRAGRAAWTLLFYALWHRRHIEGRELLDDTIQALA
jgi:asparagine synthase (glutamine-hydrolysing)